MNFFSFHHYILSFVIVIVIVIVFVIVSLLFHFYKTVICHL